MKNQPVEYQAIALLATNQALGAAKWLLAHVEPALAPILVLIQVVIGMFTVVWIYRRSVGAKLDNELKRRELNKE